MSLASSATRHLSVRKWKVLYTLLAVSHFATTDVSEIMLMTFSLFLLLLYRTRTETGAFESQSCVIIVAISHLPVATFTTLNSISLHIFLLNHFNDSQRLETNLTTAFII